VCRFEKVSIDLLQQQRSLVCDAGHGKQKFFTALVLDRRGKRKFSASAERRETALKRSTGLAAIALLQICLVEIKN
jgi:hypothetical protein